MIDLRRGILMLYALLPAWGLGAGCGGDANFLEGSIGRRFELGFDQVVIQRDPALILVRYQDNIEFPEISYQGTNTVLELAVGVIPDAQLVDQWLDMTADLELNRYVLVMQTPYLLTQDERRFPAVFQAQVKYFEMGADPGEWLSGQFYVIFTEGSTLRGGFTARLGGYPS